MLTFEKIRSYYNDNLWTKKMVADAVLMNKITEEQYKEITDENYFK